MKKISFLFLLICLTLGIVSCDSDDFTEQAAYYAQRRADFTIQRISFNYEMEKVSAWRHISGAYSYSPGDITPRQDELAAVVGYSYEEEDREASCREEARKIYLNLCELASEPEHFAWLYENKVRTLRMPDIEINKSFSREVVNKVFNNEDFKPDSVWVAYLKGILGREYYLGKR